MTEQVNPLVGDAPEELVAPETPEVAPAPIAEGTTEPIERRSRRAGKQTATTEPVDLTQFEEFRKFQAEVDRQKAEADKRIAEAHSRAADLERQMQERAQREATDRLAYLESVMDDETLETEQRRTARQEHAFLQSQVFAQQWQRWEAYKRSEIQAAGLDPLDARFQRQYSAGQAGLAEFQADLAAAQNAVLKQQLEQARKQAAVASPETIAQLVQQELAKALKAQGVDRVDLGEPSAGPDDADAYERAWAAYNSGDITAAEFQRRIARR